MSIEQYTNAPVTRTTLNGDINNSTTSVVVADGSVFPSSGIFRIIIDTEIMKVTARSTNTLTVVRADGSSTAASHASGATVRQVITKEALERVNTVIARALAYSSLPSAAETNEGQLTLVTDGPSIFRSDGSTQVPWGPIWRLTPPPIVSSWTWINPGGATATDLQGTIRLRAPANASLGKRILKRSAPSTPYTIISLVGLEIHAVNFNQIGLGWRDSSLGKLRGLYFGFDLTVSTAGVLVRHIAADSATGSQTTVASDASSTGNLHRAYYWVKLTDDGTNQTVSFSYHGDEWELIDTRARTYFNGVTTMTSDEVFFCADPINANAWCGVKILSWEVT